MTTQLNNLPNYEQKFVDRVNSKDWYFFLVGLYNRLPPAIEAPVVLGVSPYSYIAPVGGTVIVSGGTVSDIAFSRGGAVFYSTGQTAGMFTLNAQDTLRITYTVSPTTTFVPT